MSDTTKAAGESQKIEVLRCHDCGQLVISIDDKRVPTFSAAEKGHGSSKCSGTWRIVVTTENL